MKARVLEKSDGSRVLEVLDLHMILEVASEEILTCCYMDKTFELTAFTEVGCFELPRGMSEQLEELKDITARLVYYQKLAKTQSNRLGFLRQKLVGT